MRRSAPLPRIALLAPGLVATALLAACETTGVETRPDTGVPVLRGVLDLAIGVFEGEEPYMFGQVSGAALDRADGAAPHSETLRSGE